MKDPFLLFIPLPFILFALYWAFILKPRLATLANAFLDNGDHLLVWIGGVEERIMLHDITTVESTRDDIGSAERVTIRLRPPRHLGDKFWFISPEEWRLLGRFSESDFVSDLRKRVFMARAEQKQNLT